MEREIQQDSNEEEQMQTQTRTGNGGRVRWLGAWGRVFWGRGGGGGGGGTESSREATEAWGGRMQNVCSS